MPSEPRNWELAFESRTGIVSWELRAGENWEPGIKHRELGGTCDRRYKIHAPMRTRGGICYLKDGAQSWAGQKPRICV